MYVDWDWKEERDQWEREERYSLMQVMSAFESCLALSELPMTSHETRNTQKSPLLGRT
jgi:hypothetical protein